MHSTLSAASLLSLVALLATSSSVDAKAKRQDAAGQHSYTLSQVYQKGTTLGDIPANDIKRAKALGRAVTDVSSLASTGLRAAFVSLAASSATPLNTDVSIDNGFGSYYVNLQVGTPAQNNPLMMVDTGSSITWVNATAPGFDPSKSSTAVNTGLGINQTYGIGSFDGDAYTETVTFQGEQGPLTATGQIIGVATSQTTFDGLDGILGLGPTSQAQGQLYDKETGTHLDQTIPTVADTLYAQGQIASDVFALAFRPTTSSDTVTYEGPDGLPVAAAAGTLTFGGPNLDDVQGEISYVPKSTDPTVAEYWGFTIDSVSIDTIDGNTYTPVAIQTSPASGIVDSASTLFALPDAVYTAYMAAYPGSETNSGFLLMPYDQVTRMGNMTFTIGGNEFVFSPSAQLFPSDVQQQLTGTTPESLGYYITVFTNNGVGNGGEYTFGMYWLERFYTVFDASLQRIGFGYTDYTFQRTTELAAYRRTRRWHREHKKRTAWSGGKNRVAALGSRSPFAAGAAAVAAGIKVRS